MWIYQGLILAALLAIAALVRRNLTDYRIPKAGEPGPSGGISVLVPARNEAGNIARCLDGLLRQDCAEYEVLVLDDGSTDGTAEMVRELAARESRLRLLSGKPLPAGWAGKAHACWQLAQHARYERLLFLDADTFGHAPELLRAATRAADETGADLLSSFPRQETLTLGECCTVPFIYWILFTLLPIRRVELDPNPALTAACGQLLFVSREAYFVTDGHKAIRDSLHDGLHLARHFKRSGRRVALRDLSPYVSCRMYCGWRECWSGFTRNAYQGIGSLPALCFVSTLELALFLLPYLFLTGAAAGGWPGWSPLVIFQVAILLGIQIALRARFRYPWLTVLLHPLGVTALLLIQWSSWWKTRRGARGLWKGRQIQV